MAGVTSPLTIFWILLLLGTITTTTTTTPFVNAQQQQQDPTKLNGGSCLAMAGRDCVALVLDSRFGSGTNLINVQARHVLLPPRRRRSNGSGSSTTTSTRRQEGDEAMEEEKIATDEDENDNDSRQPIDESLFLVALQGLQSDVLSLEQELKQAMHNKYGRGSIARVNIAVAHNNNGHGDIDDDYGDGTMTARALASYTSRLLYNRKQAPYYVEPMIVGLEPYYNEKSQTIAYRPYLGTMDLLGSLQEQPLLSSSSSSSQDEDDDQDYNNRATFCCLGTAVPSLYGAAQAFWRPNLEAPELARTAARAFLAACERDCLSGYGARLYLITPEQGIQVMDISTRND